MGRIVEVIRPDGGVTPAYLAEPPEGQAAQAPGVVLVQEWWGLNDHIRGVADRLAAEGYRVLSPDLYRGRLTTQTDEASHMMNTLDFRDATLQDLAGCVRHLAQHGHKVGLTGFCMGGALTVCGAAQVPGVAAAVCFYGIPPRQVADPADIRIPFQGHFALQDDWCTPAVVDVLAEAMRAAGNPPDVYQYPAQHAFFNHSRPTVYDRECAETAWARMLAFWSLHLAD